MGQPESGTSVPTVVATLVGEWSIRARRYMRCPGQGRCGPPAEGGTSAISAPARGTPFPHLHVGSPGRIRPADMVGGIDQDIRSVRLWRGCPLFLRSTPPSGRS
jgi:hypothetical protein